MVAKIRGWVYVLSNRAMPGLLKVGHSTKDPNLRLSELNGTGLPHSFVVEYDLLVLDPREVELAVHARLKPKHEAKEFFRTSVLEAIGAIRAVVRDQEKDVLAEYFRSPDVKPSAGRTDRASWAAEAKNLSPGKCPICKALVAQSESRCPNCFTLIN